MQDDNPSEALKPQPSELAGPPQEEPAFDQTVKGANETSHDDQRRTRQRWVLIALIVFVVAAAAAALWVLPAAHIPLYYSVGVTLVGLAACLAALIVVIRSGAGTTATVVAGISVAFFGQTVISPAVNNIWSYVRDQQRLEHERKLEQQRLEHLERLEQERRVSDLERESRQRDFANRSKHLDQLRPLFSRQQETFSNAAQTLRHVGYCLPQLDHSLSARPCWLQVMNAERTFQQRGMGPPDAVRDFQNDLRNHVPAFVRDSELLGTRGEAHQTAVEGLVSQLALQLRVLLTAEEARQSASQVSLAGWQNVLAEAMVTRCLNRNPSDQKFPEAASASAAARARAGISPDPVATALAVSSANMVIEGLPSLRFPALGALNFTVAKAQGLAKVATSYIPDENFAATCKTLDAAALTLSAEADRLSTEAKRMATGHELEGDCEFLRH